MRRRHLLIALLLIALVGRRLAVALRWLGVAGVPLWRRLLLLLLGVTRRRLLLVLLLLLRRREGWGARRATRRRRAVAHELLLCHLQLLLITHGRSLPHLTHRWSPHAAHAAHAAHPLLVSRWPLQVLQVARLEESAHAWRVVLAERGGRQLHI